MKSNRKLTLPIVSLNIYRRERDKEEWDIINFFRSTMFIALDINFIQFYSIQNLFIICFEKRER